MNYLIALNCLLIVIFYLTKCFCQKNNNMWDNRNTIVHLFEWKWKDIGDECERFLQYKGYGGVQISPPNENLILENRPWWERYQAVSYKLITRSGSEREFVHMTKRCNKVGIRIYVDAVINHMTGLSGNGTGGNYADIANGSYPGVPYSMEHFHEKCDVDFDHPNVTNFRICRLVHLIDLNQGLDYVQSKIVDYMNHLIDLGVAGFRIDAAKHMWPEDLQKIYSKLKNLNTNYGFPEGSKPFIYQEVIDYGNDIINEKEYTDIGTVVEFKYSKSISNVFRGNDKLTYLQNWGPNWGFVDGLDALAFVCNHDNQRTTDGIILTYKEPKQYKMATAFMLAHPYGTTRVMSSFAFETFDQGPPMDSNGEILSPQINHDGTCSNGWVCEHRWRQIYNMVEFKNVVKGTGINDWWSNGDQQIAFCRGDKGFIVFTNFGDINRKFQTCLSPGIYCDVISGSLANGRCTGKSVTVEDAGFAQIQLGGLEFDGVLAIHANSKQNR